MALVPYALRPRNILRRTAIKRAVSTGSVFWRALSIYFVRGPKVLRTQAMMRSFGGDRMWRAVGFVTFLAQDVRRVLTRQPEVLATERLKSGQFVNVRVDTPLSRKEQKRTGITRKVLEQRVLADVAAAKDSEPTS